MAAGVGQPHVHIRELTVGGTAAMSDLEALAGSGVDAALAAGAGEAEAWCEEATSRQIRVYDGAVESLSDAGSRGIGIRAFIDGRSGYAYGTDLSEDGLRALGAAAHAAAEVADQDEFGGLPDETGASDVDGPRVAGDGGVDHRAEGRAGAGRGARRARAGGDLPGGERGLLGRRGRRRDRQLARLRGLLPRHPGVGLRLGLRGRGRGPDDRHGHRPRPRSRASSTPRRSAPRRRTARSTLVGARQPESRRCPVVLDAFVAASFAGFIGSMLSADAVQRGRSLFAGREGEEVAEAAFVLVDDGRHPDGPASAPFDGEGSPTRRTPLIEHGQARRLPLRRADGPQGRPRDHRERQPRLLPLAAVGRHHQPAGRAGRVDARELVAQAGDGLYVTDVAGLHSGVNPVSGTFSVAPPGG